MLLFLARLLLPFAASAPATTGGLGSGCGVAALLGCYDVANCPTGGCADPLLPRYQPQLHDKVTLGNCAEACWGLRLAVAGIGGGNHCFCGSAGDLAAARSHTRPAAECQATPCHAAPAEKCGGAGRLLAYNFSCSGPPPPLPPPPPPPPTPPPLYPHTGPLACQPNDRFPMLPTFHIIGNVTQATDGRIALEEINDCSGVTYYQGIYHVWHQCCQNHWDHVISKDLVHWQRLPPPMAPGERTFDGSISMLPMEAESWRTAGPG